MRKIPLRTVILLAFIAGAIATIVIGAGNYWIVSKNSKTIELLAKERAVYSEHLGSLRYSLLMHRRYEKDLFLNIGNREKQKGYEQKFDEQSRLMKELISKFQSDAKNLASVSDDLKKEAASLDASYESYHSGAKSVFNSVFSDASIDSVKANTLMKAHKKPIHSFETTLTKFEDAGKGIFTKTEHNLLGMNKTSQKVLLILLPVSVLFIIAISLFISNYVKRSLEKPISTLDAIAFQGNSNIAIDTDGRTDEIGKLLKAIAAVVGMLENKSMAANAIASGDLTKDMEVLSTEDELGNSFRRMSDDLSSFFTMLFDTATNITESAGGIQASSEGLSQATTQQAASIEEISSTLAEVASQSNTNAQNADQAQSISMETRQSAEQGNERMRGMVMAMEDINQSSEHIAKIIKVIDDIAFQTNLLALNAAVEAARAGRHGKGFAVVAEEVRNLAGRSAKAARETAELIQSSGEKVKKGSEIANLTSTSLEEIVSSAIKTTDLISEITAASREQALGVEQINQGISQMENATQQNSANAEETASAATELKSMADTLYSQLGRFKLKNGSGTRTMQSAPTAASAPYPSTSYPQATRPSAPAAALPMPSVSARRQKGDLLTWGPEFSVSVDKFDNQHKKLFDMVNNLHRALKAGKADDILGPILVELAEYTTTHFAEEEAMFRVHNYPEAGVHIKAHKELLEQVGSVKERFENGQKLGIEVMHFLKDWLMTHIMETDKKYGEFFIAKNVPGTTRSAPSQRAAAPPPRNNVDPEDIISLDNDDWGRY